MCSWIGRARREYIYISAPVITQIYFVIFFFIDIPTSSLTSEHPSHNPSCPPPPHTTRPHPHPHPHPLHAPFPSPHRFHATRHAPPRPSPRPRPRLRLRTSTRCSTASPRSRSRTRCSPSNSSRAQSSCSRRPTRASRCCSNSATRLRSLGSRSSIAFVLIRSARVAPLLLPPLPLLLLLLRLAHYLPRRQCRCPARGWDWGCIRGMGV